MFGLKRENPFPTRVVSIPNIMGGQPTLEGTRITAEMIALHIREGYSRTAILEAYPHLPADGIEAVLRWAAEQGETLPPPPIK
jgi:uncharacterized protein (DUF433 family)